MSDVIKSMFDSYRATTRDEAEQALREILQEVVLLGVWRAKLFEKMAFYGGTALRILHGLNRFSEDIDFTMLKAEPDFSWAPFAKTIETELKNYGFNFELKQKSKMFKSSVESAFLKTNTLKAMLQVEIPQTYLEGYHPTGLLKIKIEVDKNPVEGFRTSTEMLRYPLPVPIQSVALPDLFASKLHAALYRAWKDRVKGRDWYDVLWYIRNKIPLSLEHFKACMKHNQTDTESIELSDIASLQGLINNKVDSLDMEKVKEDVRYFVRSDEVAVIDLWDQAYLKSWIDKLELERE
ncbi:MAG: nucleotidyl transferase AbiEii/AbiGii toxin family protein [Chlamydiales bacterium]|nr:nucleotidyl transferase AbiEii/AbiGii toxin family protein [Chlamydiales bacterium]